ncbi:hypothetical protein GCM10010269_27830 [Streptomyces humidus]|uniref:Uncharacterized protein n=1 Tax=Streptomyces humidus TaxID=52259 RepID=A0A918FUP2_9ACTN|nr:hypothetical protein GCM10010269_27830 [Streptomyces humidus]
MNPAHGASPSAAGFMSAWGSESRRGPVTATVAGPFALSMALTVSGGPAEEPRLGSPFMPESSPNLFTFRKSGRSLRGENTISGMNGYRRERNGHVRTGAAAGDPAARP